MTIEHRKQNFQFNSILELEAIIILDETNISFTLFGHNGMDLAEKIVFMEENIEDVQKNHLLQIDLIKLINQVF